jgi:hypothetical protein
MYEYSARLDIAQTTTASSAITILAGRVTIDLTPNVPSNRRAC